MDVQRQQILIYFLQAEKVFERRTKESDLKQNTLLRMTEC